MKRTAVLLLLIAFVATPPAAAQAPNAGDGVRFGLSFGGVSTVAATVELFRDARSVDVTFGTWSFRDVSVSAVVKQYFGGGAARPVVGAGLWAVAAAPGGRTGWALVLRAPIGVDWSMADRHALGGFLNVNRAIWVRRSNPRDDVPLNRRLVPLPEIYYRFTR